MCCTVSFQQLPLQVQPGPVCIPLPQISVLQPCTAPGSQKCRIMRQTEQFLSLMDCSEVHPHPSMQTSEEQAPGSDWS